MLGKYKIFVPKKRKYYIETLYSHYEHTHYATQLDITREIIAEKYPDYLKSYDEVVKHTYGYMFNMMIMQKRYLNDYCEWLFDILFELEKRIDPQELSAFQGRFYGRVSEIIFNVWLDGEIKLGKIKKNEIKVSTLLKFADALGYDLVLVMRDTVDGYPNIKIKPNDKKEES